MFFVVFLGFSGNVLTTATTHKPGAVAGAVANGGIRCRKLADKSEGGRPPIGSPILLSFPSRSLLKSVPRGLQEARYSVRGKDATREATSGGSV